jgi:hypothetical protein
MATKRLAAAALVCIAVLAIRWAASGERDSSAAAQFNVENAAHSTATQRTNQAAPLSPRVEIMERDFDFGAVEPLVAYEHSFTFRNSGTAPLLLKSRGSGCKCLKITVFNAEVAPGATGLVVVRWEPTPAQDIFLQRTTIETNDAQNPRIDLKLMGKARRLLAADPPTLAAPRIKPDQQAQVTTTIVSQVWDQFTIDAIESPLAGATWQLAPADSEQLARLKAKSGWNLVLTLPVDMPTGPFASQLQFMARPAPLSSNDTPAQAASGSAITRTIPVEGSVLRRLAVYGEGVTPAGTIEAGTIDPRAGYSGTYILRVNDDQPELKVTQITTEPALLEARLERYAESGASGIYRIFLHIRPSDVAAVYQGENRGKLSITFDHPRIKSLDLGVEFVALGLPSTPTESARQPFNSPKPAPSHHSFLPNDTSDG